MFVDRENTMGGRLMQLLSKRKRLTNLKQPINKKVKKGAVYYLKKDFILYLFLLPPIIYYLVFHYGPMYGVVIAFKDYNIFKGVFASAWVGFDVFREVFKMPEFYRALRNTISLNMLGLVIGFPAPIILAIVINELPHQKFKKFAQLIVYLPHFLSFVIIGGMALQIFSPTTGLINDLIVSRGGTAIPFLIEKYHWVATYIGISLWHGTGWGTIIYLAAITGVNGELYEAAEIDGAGRIRKIWHITLPGIKSTVVILLILHMGKMMSISFDAPYILGNSFVSDFSDVISTFVYRVGLGSSRFNIATAVGLFQSLIGIILLVTTNFIAEKLGEDGIW